MWKTRDIYDIKIAMLAIGVSFASLFLALPLIYIFLYHCAYCTDLPDILILAMAFVTIFLVFLSSASFTLGIASSALNLYYRFWKPKKQENKAF